MLGNRKEKKKYSKEKNCQGGLQQESYLGRQTSNMIRNTRQGQKGIGDDRKKEEQKDKKQWK